jgi:hypothetical protein
MSLRGNATHIFKAHGKWVRLTLTKNQLKYTISTMIQRYNDTMIQSAVELSCNGIDYECGGNYAIESNK